MWKDCDSLVRYANNRNVWLNLEDRFPHPYTKDDAKRWLEIATEIKPETNFAIAVEGWLLVPSDFQSKATLLIVRRRLDIGWAKNFGDEVLPPSLNGG